MVEEKLKKALALIERIKPSWKVVSASGFQEDYSRLRFEVGTEDGDMRGSLDFESRNSAMLWGSLHISLTGRVLIFEGNYKKGTEEYDLLKSFRNSLAAWQPIKKLLEEKEERENKLRNKYLR